MSRSTGQFRLRAMHRLEAHFPLRQVLLVVPIGIVVAAVAVVAAAVAVVVVDVVVLTLPAVVSLFQVEIALDIEVLQLAVVVGVAVAAAALMGVRHSILWVWATLASCPLQHHTERAYRMGHRQVPPLRQYFPSTSAPLPRLVLHGRRVSLQC